MMVIGVGEEKNAAAASGPEKPSSYITESTAEIICHLFSPFKSNPTPPNYFFPEEVALCFDLHELL
jgi:hypothetical protein